MLNFSQSLKANQEHFEAQISEMTVFKTLQLIT